MLKRGITLETGPMEKEAEFVTTEMDSLSSKVRDKLKDKKTYSNESNRRTVLEHTDKSVSVPKPI